MKSLLDYTDEEKEKILIRAHRRKLYYKIHRQINKLHLWTKAVYRPLHPADKQSLLIFARSIIETTDRIRNLAFNLIDILEEEDVSQKKEV